MTFDLWGRDCQKALVGARGHLPTKYELNRCSRLGGRRVQICVGKKKKKEKEKLERKDVLQEAQVCLHVLTLSLTLRILGTEC